MGKFNWWRRYKKKAPLQKKNALQGKSFVLQQIENGDYDVSDYRRQALEEIDRCKKEQAKITKSWKAGPESLQYELDQIERKYIKRYNKLMEDYHEEERRLLVKLRIELKKQFEVDCWHEALEATKNEDLIGFYNKYKQIALQKHAQ
jgi:dsDNA-specific endonuclease/ATPase MutS2